MLLLVLLWGFGGLVGYAAAQRKGFSLVAGTLAGVLLGPVFAWVLFAVSGIVTDDEARRRCPHCAEWIQRAATICKHCQQPVPALAAPPARPTRIVTPILIATHADPHAAEPDADSVAAGTLHAQRDGRECVRPADLRHPRAHHWRLRRLL
jgi:hypothetical protein